MHHPTERMTHITAFVTPVVEHWLEREIAQWVHPMNDRSNDPLHHERTPLPRSYISLLLVVETIKDIMETAEGGIAPNEVIARSEFEVHRQMFTE